MFFGPSNQLVKRAGNIDTNSITYISEATDKIQLNQQLIFDYLFEDQPVDLHKFWLIAESACVSYITFLLFISNVRGKNKLMEIVDMSVSKMPQNKKALAIECSSYINTAIEQTMNMPSTELGRMLMLMMFYGEWIRSKIQKNTVTRSAPVLHAMEIGKICLANSSDYWVD
jgi:hypothetical protein